MSTPTRKQLQRTHGERGASLVIALVFITVFSLMLMGLSQFTDANVRASGGYRSQRTVNYATDAALDAAVNRVAHDESIGVDPAISPTDTCNAANNQTVFSLPASGTKPKIVVSCQVTSGSGSGRPAEYGDEPEYALLTLGDRRTTQNDGTVSTTPGVRNNEPAPYNVSSDACNSESGGTYQEQGIRQNDTIWSGRWFIFFPTCGYEPDNSYWGVQGNLFSNSKIKIDTAKPGCNVELGECPVPTTITDPDGVMGTIEARGGCSGTGFGGPNTTCTDAGWDFSDGKGRDPGLVTPTAYAPRSLTGLSVQTVPPASQCTNARKLVTFLPGIYTDATQLNSLFANSSCKEATFWFTPGTYYFDFRNTPTTSTSSQCGAAAFIEFDPDIDQNTAHQWCIAGAGDDYGAQHVIGGTPYNWSPTADPVTHVITLDPAGDAGDGPGTFFGLFPQPTQFVNGDLCPGGTTQATLTACAETIDGKTINYTMSAGNSGSSVWMSNYTPKVPRGSYSAGIDLELSQAALNANRMNAPSIQVNYQTVGFLGLATTGTCGPYTLPQPTASLTTIKLSTVNPTAAANLSTCLNTGDKINSAVVQYNVNRPGFQGSPYATAKLDGVRILVTAQDQPTFPRPPSATDPGGDCDPSAPGVQFIFGGDSHVYLPNGGMELCAGPNPADPLHGQQVAVYGVPATPRVVPTSASGGTNPDNARSIADGAGVATAYASMTAGQSVTLNYAGYTVPSGYSLSTVQMRASYDSPGSSASAALQNAGGGALSGSGCTNPVANQGGVTSNPVQSRIINVTGCLTAANLASPFRVQWTGGSCSGANCPKLDGVEFIITLTPDSPDTTLRPQNGCINASSNYWYGAANGVSQDCALLRVDSRFTTPIGGVFGGVRQGRLSVKGTIYAPSAAVDIDDTDVWYPIASRGVVARHLRIRGFQNNPGYNGPAFNSFVDTTMATRQVVFLACRKDSGSCTPGDPTLVGRAAVEFAAKTSEPQIQAWSVGKI